MGVFPDFVMQFLINLCGRDKYSGVTAILIDITKEYSWGKLEGRSIYASRTFSNFCSPRTRRANSSLCVEISWNTRRRNFVSDSTRSGSCANDKPAQRFFLFFPLLPRATSIIRAPEVRAWLHEHQCTERDTEERILRRYWLPITDALLCRGCKIPPSDFILIQTDSYRCLI